MSTTTHVEGSAILARTLAEGYGPGAWHGSDFKAAIADVNEGLAFRRLAPERHNIAEIALHHAYCVHMVRGRLTGTPTDPFVLQGDDWFELSDRTRLTWNQIVGIVEQEQQQLADLVAKLGKGTDSPLSDAEQFDLVLGITCHAIYHAGQVQLIKKML